MLLRRLAASAAATTVALAGVVVGTATPSSASDPLAGTYKVSMTGTTAGVFLNGLQISGTCAIVSTGVVAATVIESCYLRGTGGASHSIALPGNAAAVTFTQRVSTLDFQLCYSGYVVPVTDPAARYPVAGCASLPLDDSPVTSGVHFESY